MSVTKDCKLSQVLLFGDSHLTVSRPLSIYTLASLLKTHGILCQTVWAWNHVSDDIFKNICQKFLSYETLIVGISSTLLSPNSNLKENFWGVSDKVAKKRFKLIKKLAPNAQLVVGGSQLLELPISGIPLKEHIDFFVTGEGEASLLSIVNARLQGQRVITTQLSPAVVAQESYPYNDFSTTDTRLDKSDCIIHGEALPTEFARGCIFRCSFCSYPLIGKNKSDFNKTVATLVSEFKHNYDQFGTTNYYVADDLLNDSEDKVNLVLEVSEQLPFQLTYTAFIRLDMIRRFPSMATKLKDSGLIGCFMGIETVNDTSGRSVGKGLGVNRINEGLSVLQELWNNEVITESGFILGLPHDTPETKFELLEWLRQPLVRNTIRYPNVAALHISPYKRVSEIEKDPESFGYTISNGSWYSSTYNQHQATDDSKWLLTQYYNDRKFNVPFSNQLDQLNPARKFSNRVDVFSLPYLLSISDCREEILNLMLNDCSQIFIDDQTWKTWVAQRCYYHREQYFNKLLEG